MTVTVLKTTPSSTATTVSPSPSFSSISSSSSSQLQEALQEPRQPSLEGEVQEREREQRHQVPVQQEHRGELVVEQLGELRKARPTFGGALRSQPLSAEESLFLQKSTFKSPSSTTYSFSSASMERNNEEEKAREGDRIANGDGQHEEEKMEKEDDGGEGKALLTDDGDETNSSSNSSSGDEDEVRSRKRKSSSKRDSSELNKIPKTEKTLMAATRIDGHEEVEQREGDELLSPPPQNELLHAIKPCSSVSSISDLDEMDIDIENSSPTPVTPPKTSSSTITTATNGSPSPSFPSSPSSDAINPFNIKVTPESLINKEVDDLPPGWSTTTKIRRQGGARKERYLVSPDGRLYRSKIQVYQVLGVPKEDIDNAVTTLLEEYKGKLPKNLEKSLKRRKNRTSGKPSHPRLPSPPTFFASSSATSLSSTRQSGGGGGAGGGAGGGGGGGRPMTRSMKPDSSEFSELHAFESDPRYKINEGSNHQADIPVYLGPFKKWREEGKKKMKTVESDLPLETEVSVTVVKRMESEAKTEDAPEALREAGEKTETVKKEKVRRKLIDEPLWDPSRISQENIEDFLEKARALLKKELELRTSYYLMMDLGNYPIKKYSRRSFVEQELLNRLHCHDYQVEEVLEWLSREQKEFEEFRDTDKGVARILFAPIPVDPDRWTKLDALEDETCFYCEKEGKLMICDNPSCKRVFHSTCVRFNQIPENDWICPVCMTEQVLVEHWPIIGKEKDIVLAIRKRQTDLITTINALKTTASMLQGSEKHSLESPTKSFLRLPNGRDNQKGNQVEHQGHSAIDEQITLVNSYIYHLENVKGILHKRRNFFCGLNPTTQDLVSQASQAQQLQLQLQHTLFRPESLRAFLPSHLLAQILAQMAPFGLLSPFPQPGLDGGWQHSQIQQQQPYPLQVMNYMVETQKQLQQQLQYHQSPQPPQQQQVGSVSHPTPSQPIGTETSKTLLPTTSDSLVTSTPPRFIATSESHSITQTIATPPTPTPAIPQIFIPAPASSEPSYSSSSSSSSSSSPSSPSSSSSSSSSLPPSEDLPTMSHSSPSPSSPSPSSSSPSLSPSSTTKPLWNRPRKSPGKDN